MELGDQNGEGQRHQRVALWPALGLEKREDLTIGHAKEARIGTAHVTMGQTPQGLFFVVVVVGMLNKIIATVAIVKFFLYIFFA